MAKTPPPAATDFTLTADNYVGIVQRDLAILQAHLNQPVVHINGPACVAHLERMMTIMSRIPGPEQMQGTENGKTEGARAN